LQLWHFYLSAYFLVLSAYSSHPPSPHPGHAAPVLCATFVPRTPQIVSCDAAGGIRVWDARTFACAHAFNAFPIGGSGMGCAERNASQEFTRDSKKSLA
jgi:hypothetical protein